MKPLVLQSDFGQKDGAVCAMYGVAKKVNDKLKIYDLTHDIPQYDIWEASYRLIQTITYWQPGTVFVSVVDPGVGSNRKSVVVKTISDKYIVTPNNGTLTHVKLNLGIKEVREIDEKINRLPYSGESYTFHGRDIYSYTGARLATNTISFEEVGPLLDINDIVLLPVNVPEITNNQINGCIDTLDIRFGSLWSNIPRELFLSLNVNYGELVEVTITNNQRIVYKNVISYAKSFADVNVGEILLYINSLDCIALAINQGSFSKAYNVSTGISWKISLRKAPKIIYE